MFKLCIARGDIGKRIEKYGLLDRGELFYDTIEGLLFIGLGHGQMDAFKGISVSEDGSKINNIPLRMPPHG